MYRLPRTATIFKSNGENIIKIFMDSISEKEVLEINPLDKGILHLHYQWLQPLIIRGKHLLDDKYTSDLMWFNKKQVLVILGHNHEHVINTLSQRTKYEFTQIPLFKKYQEIMGKESEPFNVVNLTLNLNASMDMDSENLKNYAMKQIMSEKVLDKALPMLHSYLLKTNNEKYFNITKENEIEMYDTDTDEEVMDVLKTIIQALSAE